MIPLTHRYRGGVTIVSAAVLGSGPAALSTAAALSCAGVDTVLIAPSVEAPWLQTFSMWTDQWSPDVAELTGLANPWSRRWSRVMAFGEKTHHIDRAYGTLDNENVRRALLDRALASGCLTVLSDRVETIEHLDQHSELALGQGDTLSARLVFDGTGAGSSFVVREPQPDGEPVLQTAFGRIVSASSVPFDDNSAVLMDWRGPRRSDPSFLYALGYGDGRWLFEETSLAHPGGLLQSELAIRLDKRLHDLGIVIEETHATEEVSFPMEVALPVKSQAVVGIGAAGALVHPATGYSVAASLRMAPRFARAVTNEGSDRAVAIERCAEVLWSADRRRARGLETYGLKRLLTMDQHDTQAFFDVFFSLSNSAAATYLGGEAGSKELSAVMWQVFRKSPRRLRQRLATGNPLVLAKSLLS